MIDDIAPAYATATVVTSLRSLKKMLSMIAPETNLTHFDVVISQLGRIGPAVNLAARLEKLAGQLGRSIVASQEFARHGSHDLMQIGRFAVAGFAEEQTAFGLRDKGRDT